jgi:hypothetical protein
VPVAIDVLGNDGLPAGQEIRIVAVTLPFKGKLVFNPDGTITYTPGTGFVGFDDFTYTIGNDRGGTARARVTIEVTPAVEANVYANGYSYRRRIVVPASSARGGSHANFPLWVELSGAWLKSTTDDGKMASTDGRDLRFELENGTKLAHEIEHYDAGAGKLGAWVRLPELNADQPTVILVHYGKADLAESEENPSAVWQDYLAVWHLPGVEDVTSAGRLLTPSGTIADAPHGLGTGALALNGNGALRIDDTAWLQGLPALSIQLRCRADTSGHDQGQLNVGQFGSDAVSDLVVRYQAVGFAGSQPSNVIHSKIRTTIGNTGVSSSAMRQTTTWQGLAVTWQSGDISPDLYIDGVKNTPSFKNEISGPATTLVSGPLHLGAGSRDSGNGGWVGLLDEVRFRAVKLDAAWIQAEHLNQNSPALFYGLGAEETIAEPTDSIVALPFDVRTPAGHWIEIDALATAQIPPGTPGPTIQAVSQPANGTVAVINDKIRYSPVAGFVGEDGFSFTLEAAGRTSAAQVRVMVETAVSQEQGGSGSTSTPLRTINVTNASQLTSALSNAVAGDEIVLANGTYGGNFLLAQNGSATNPITVRAATLHQAILTGRLTLQGKWTIVRQLAFNGGSKAVVVEAEDCRVTRCRFSNTKSAAIALTAVCRRPQVDYNLIEDYDFRGISGEATPSDYPRNPYIHHNYLKNQVSTNGGGIIMGEANTHTNHRIDAIIEYNLIDGFSGIEPLSAKSSGNTFRFNTVKNADGVIMCRHGTHNDFIGNSSINAGGVMLHGRWNRAIGNYHDGLKTGGWRSPNVAAGTVSQGEILSSGGGSVYPHAEDCLFAGNIGPFILGGGNSSSSLPALRTIIEGHSGTTSGSKHTGTIYRDLTVTVPAHVVLSAAEVGPGAGLEG